MNSHTKGPWRILDRSRFIVHGTESERGNYIGSVDVEYKSKAEIEANQRLISAAPELLEALNGLLQHIDYNTVPFQQIVIALAAINKARGES